MAELILERNERLTLRAQAHHLAPMVLLGAQGFTDAVIKEIDRALKHHGLIKVHVPSDDREERMEIYHTVAAKLNAARIQMIGKMLVFYRPQEDDAEKATAKAATQKLVLGAKADPGARGARKPVDPKAKAKKAPAKPAVDKKGKKIVIKARPKHKRLTKKAALA